MNKIKALKFDNPFEAWIGINKWWFNNFQTLDNRGGGRYGSELFMPNVFFHCGNGDIPPNLDLGKILGYSPVKWNTLITNYLSYNGIHEVRRLVKEKEQQNKTNYNVVMMFTNNYKNGKGCLISLQFSKRPRSKERVITISTRATEITKRLIFDLLLVQRVAEFVYKGLDIQYNIQFFSPHVYQCAESFVLMANYKPLSWWDDGNTDTWKVRVHGMYNKYMDAERAATMKLQCHVQTAKHLRGERDVDPLLIKDLKLYLSEKEKARLSKTELNIYNNKIEKMKLIPSVILK